MCASDLHARLRFGVIGSLLVQSRDGQANLDRLVPCHVEPVRQKNQRGHLVGQHTKRDRRRVHETRLQGGGAMRRQLTHQSFCILVAWRLGRSGQPAAATRTCVIVSGICAGRRPVFWANQPGKHARRPRAIEIDHGPGHRRVIRRRNAH